MAKINLGKIGKSLGQSLGGLLGGDWQQSQSRDAWENPITGQTIDSNALRQMALQQRMTYPDYGYYTTAQTITISPDYFGALKPKPKKAETALEWLDRRVAEMRVAL